MSFDTLGLKPELLRAVADKGYTVPTPIQLEAIPAVLAGRDVLAGAQTGTGKTAGFVLPMLQKLGERGARNPRALVLTPTRELAAQVEQSVQDYGKYVSLRSQVIFGGVSEKPQIDKARHGCDILVATPGRLLDLCQQRAVSLADIQVFVLDEADRMLDMGFIHDIKRVLKLLPQQRQNLMFSATYSDDIRDLASRFVKNPVSVQVTPRNATADKVSRARTGFRRITSATCWRISSRKATGTRCWCSRAPSTARTASLSNSSAPVSRPWPSMATRARTRASRRCRISRKTASRRW
jgi:ATP-dependent RNA helicase RhlE